VARDFSGTTGNYLSYATGSVFSMVTYSCGGWVNLDTNSYGSEPNGIPCMFAHAYATTHLPVVLGIGNGTGPGVATRWFAGRYDTGTGWASVADTIAAPTGAWTHVLMTMGSGTCRLYRDGAEANNGSITVTNGTTQALRVGHRWDSAATNAINGRMAELGFWTAVLGAEEVAALARGVPPQLVRRGSLLGHWPLGGAGAYPEADLAGTQRNLTQTGTVSAASDQHPPMSKVAVGAGY
jgi:hypothetical protein